LEITRSPKIPPFLPQFVLPELAEPTFWVSVKTGSKVTRNRN